MKTQVMLDYDDVPPADLLERIAQLCRYLGTRAGPVVVERTRRGSHVSFRLSRALPATALVAVQAILGSDRHRELFNLTRALVLDRAPAFWRNRWNVLYRAKAREGSI